ncbi:hypothetical protein LOTGIDRAFT_227072 [Lottia gigantea]|uniref:Uncharacterized protein n=1 Tax=Lottia gigantea TaxID=225164 RepID=V4C427_LOTGI|nr:hypothetical protein LOTGIDRAFT_227072 [Lottia gigantea]ESO96314.1 hypothetical protein LOTGIDRAFT_227072 [Lottia gigantea]
MEVRKMMEQNLAVATQKNVDMWARKEMEERFRIEDLEREAKNVQLARLHTENRSLETEVHQLMKKCQDEREKDTAEGYKELGYEVDDHISDNIRRLDRLEIEQHTSKHHTDHLLNNIQQAGTSKQISFQEPLDGYPTDESNSSKVSFERSRETFDEKEMELLNEVRRLRQRLATENRHKKPPPMFPNN